MDKILNSIVLLVRFKMVQIRGGSVQSIKHALGAICIGMDTNYSNMEITSRVGCACLIYMHVSE